MIVSKSLLKFNKNSEDLCFSWMDLNLNNTTNNKMVYRVDDTSIQRESAKGT